MATFEMDGSAHRVGDPSCCTPLVSRFEKCGHCGGRMHFQAVYGGYYHECEDCHRDEDGHPLPGTNSDPTPQS